MSLELTNQVLNALSVLYGRDHDQSIKSEANTFLLRFQGQMEAWSIADQLLKDPNQSLEVQFFMSQTLRIKIKNDLVDLDLMGRTSLKDSLLDTIVLHKDGPTHIQTQLALALCYLIIQFLEWGDGVPSLISGWGKDASLRRILLLLLTVLPQETSSNVAFNTLSDREYRDQVGRILTGNSTKVINLLIHLIQTPDSNPTVQENVFTCLLAWLKAGEISIMDMSNHPLLAYSFQCLVNQPSLFEVGCDIVCGLIYETREVQSCMPVVEEIVTHLVSVKQFLSQPDHDEDTLQGLTRIFAEAGEAYLELIVENPQPFIHILEGIVECLQKCPIRVIATTFSFWYSFAYSLSSHSPSHVEPFKPIFETTIQTVIGRLKLPNEDSDWSREEMDSFKDLRHDIGNILKDCSLVLHASAALSIPHRLLATQLERVRQGQSYRWQEFEAGLFSLRAIGTEVSYREDGVLEVMKLLPDLPSHPQLTRAVILVFSCYSEWSSHRPDLLPFQLQYVVAGLDDKDIAPASIIALYELAKFCSKHLVQHLPTLLQVFSKYETSLHPDDVKDFAAAIGFVIYQLPTETYAQNLGHIVGPILQELELLANNAAPPTILPSQLDKLRKVLENGLPNVEPGIPHPGMEVVQRLWPILEKILHNFHAHPAISESVGTLFARLIDMLAPHHLPYLPSLANALVKAFEASGLSIYIWVIKKLITNYYPTHHNELISVLDQVSGAVFQQGFKCTNLDEMPQVIEEYSAIIKVSVKLMGSTLFDLTLSDTVIQFYTAVIDVHQIHALEAGFNAIIMLMITLIKEIKSNSNPSKGTLTLLHHTRSQANTLITKLTHHMFLEYSPDQVYDATELIALVLELDNANSLVLNRAFLDLPNRPFNAKSDPNTPSKALQSMLDRIADFLRNQNYRHIQATMERFVMGYRRQQQADRQGQSDRS